MVLTVFSITSILLVILPSSGSLASTPCFGSKVACSSRVRSLALIVGLWLVITGVAVVIDTPGADASVYP